MKEKYGNIYRMDRILKAEGESPDDYKVAKQADTLMLFYNLDKTRVDQIFRRFRVSVACGLFKKSFVLSKTDVSWFDFVTNCSCPIGRNGAIP